MMTCKGGNNMSICPFLEESMWSGNKCRAMGKNGEPVQKRFSNYCGVNVLSDDYHKCPLYMDATGKRSDGCYLTTACMNAKGNLFCDNCNELKILREFRDSYVKQKYPEDVVEYYKIAPKIVEEIRKLEDREEIFCKIYNELVVPCCELIINNQTEEAYIKYKSYSLLLYKQYLV